MARISSTGADLAEMADYARSVGGPAVRELTFHQRATLLKALGKALTAIVSGVFKLTEWKPSERTLNLEPKR